MRKLSEPLRVTCFGTSIWDETLYKAWSSIVYALIPNVEILEKNLDKFTRLCEADEVVLFEKATFLVISHATHKEHEDVHRYEKISNIVKVRQRHTHPPTDGWNQLRAYCINGKWLAHSVRS